jgi:hypothetical protein
VQIVTETPAFARTGRYNLELNASHPGPEAIYCSRNCTGCHIAFLLVDSSQPQMEPMISVPVGDQSMIRSGEMMRVTKALTTGRCPGDPRVTSYEREQIELEMLVADGREEGQDWRDLAIVCWGLKAVGTMIEWPDHHRHSQIRRLYVSGLKRINGGYLDLLWPRRAGSRARETRSMAPASTAGSARRGVGMKRFVIVGGTQKSKKQDEDVVEIVTVQPRPPPPLRPVPVSPPETLLTIDLDVNSVLDAHDKSIRRIVLSPADGAIAFDAILFSDHDDSFSRIMTLSPDDTLVLGSSLTDAAHHAQPKSASTGTMRIGIRPHVSGFRIDIRNSIGPVVKLFIESASVWRLAALLTRAAARLSLSETD